MSIVFTIAIVLGLLLAIISVFFLVLAFVLLIEKKASNKKNGVAVKGIIKDVRLIKERYKYDNAVYEKHLEIDFEFLYEGKTQTLTYRVFNDLDKDKYKVGDEIECQYNTAKKELIDEYNLSFKKNKPLYFSIYCLILVLILGIIHAVTDSLIIYILLVIFAILCWYVMVYAIFGLNFYKKEKGNYIKLKGHVVDYYVSHGGGEMNLYSYYYPEISFTYNKEKVKYISSHGYDRKLYKIGQEIDVLYDPEKKLIYGQSNRTFAIIAYAIPVVCAIIALIQYLVSLK